MKASPAQARRILTIALLIVSSIPMDGASVRRLRLDEVRDQSVSVYWGQVVGRSVRIGDGGKMAWTDYEISVSEHLRGENPGIRAIVSFAGGTSGSLSVGIPGVPHLALGESYVFFIQEGSRRPTATVGWGQGLFRIARVEIGGTLRDLIVSSDGEPLQMNADGLVTRGPLVRVENGAVWDASLRRNPDASRMPNPTFTSSSGTIDEPGVSKGPRAVPLPERHFATLDDLRLFVEGRIGSAEGGQR